ncbi:hypothetical protein [Streptomyces sp. NPDC000888]
MAPATKPPSCAAAPPLAEADTVELGLPLREADGEADFPFEPRESPALGLGLSATDSEAAAPTDCFLP